MLIGSSLGNVSQCFKAQLVSVSYFLNIQLVLSYKGVSYKPIIRVFNHVTQVFSCKEVSFCISNLVHPHAVCPNQLAVAAAEAPADDPHVAGMAADDHPVVVPGQLVDAGGPELAGAKRQARTQPDRTVRMTEPGNRTLELYRLVESGIRNQINRLDIRMLDQTLEH